MVPRPIKEKNRCLPFVVIDQYAAVVILNNIISRLVEVKIAQ